VSNNPCGQCVKQESSVAQSQSQLSNSYGGQSGAWNASAQYDFTQKFEANCSYMLRY